MLKLIIGNKVYSSWSLRGWLAAKQSGLPFETVLVPLYDEAWEARKAQPDLVVSNGKVPTLWDGDIAVWDSLAIIDYLDTLSGSTRFWPQDKAALALARSMAAEMHSGYQPLRQTCGMNTRHILPPRNLGPDVAANVARITDVWEQARTRFGAEGDFLFGSFGAVDIMFAPVVSRFVTYSIAVPPAARAYMDAILAHPWMREWLDDAARESWVIPRLEPAGGI
ncbi:glutathione S-transferase [Sphingobium sp. B2D3A]|uniref:glutathione S-transferase family protein n=1 Tax=unclassified Sphingobium TaxID=2611147 RepID=UPI0022246968|nr:MULTISPECIES: glutathione S-transferase family protein [unclassified Sphingobium]MCW2336843.1 glutathione S-transferase [Sphingobium sp. B2D3A]MCW2386597.1 glutathione S-transferase [Sphingobium sp. B2D3D]